MMRSISIEAQLKRSETFAFAGLAHGKRDPVERTERPGHDVLGNALLPVL
jgi:hypothetical protein